MPMLSALFDKTAKLILWAAVVIMKIFVSSDLRTWNFRFIFFSILAKFSYICSLYASCTRSGAV